MSSSRTQLISLACLLGLEAIALVSQPSLTLAQAFKPSGIPVPPRRVFLPPRGDLAGECVPAATKPIALIPGTNFGMPLTASAHPTFFVYVPETHASSLEFTLYDSGKEVYFAQLEPNSQAGILPLPIPESVSLEAQENDGEMKVYEWTLTLVCDPSDATKDIAVTGWVHRIPDVNPEGKTAADFANLGVWYDALDAAYSEQTAAVLLDSVGLAEFTEVPLLELE
ncbi:MAG: DUF928 domain-containing protein [Oscillatoria sp. PMC 1068.18]|nr:DUF928 domain-containing protein [Oscillatoria sp. PMC 1076.18]MEC4989191.1 DUF928 domain-containing protein [Oscillatoria sp. PMC 1068.18]